MHLTTTARAMLKFALPLALMACTGPILGPVNPVASSALGALTTLDGPVADAIRAQGATIQSNLTEGCCAALLIDGDHINAAQITAQKDAIRAFINKGKPVVFLDADHADDTPGILNILGFSTPMDSAGVIYRIKRANGVTTLEEQSLPASELTRHSVEMKAKLIKVFLNGLNARLNTARLGAPTDTVCTPTNFQPCGSVPSFSSDSPSLIRAISTSKVVSFSATIPLKIKDYPGFNSLSFQGEYTNDAYATVSVSQDIFVNAEVLIKSGNTACRSVTPGGTVPNACMQYSVAAYPFIVSTPGDFDLTQYPPDSYGGIPLWTQWLPAQASWDLSWHVGLNGSPLKANLMTNILLSPLNDTSGGQKTVSSNTTFEWHVDLGAGFGIAAEGVKVSPTFNVGESVTQTTNTTTTIEDWTTTNTSDSVRFFEWKYASTNPALELQPYQGLGANYPLHKVPAGAQQGDFAEMLPSGLNRGVLRMAPTFSFSVGGGDDGSGKPVQVLDLWWTGKGKLAQVINAIQFSTDGTSPYTALSYDADLTPGTDCPPALTTCEHLSLNLPALFQAVPQ